MPKIQQRDLGDGKKPLRLTAKMLAFVDHYVATWNGMQSAKSAGYKGTDHTLAQVAYENLQRPAVKEAIKRRVSTRMMTQEEAMARVADVARGDLGRFVQVNPSGVIGLDYKKLVNERQQHLVKAIAMRPDGQLSRVEFYSALEALDKILRATGAYDDGITINLPPFDPKAWMKQADDRLREVEDLFDPYESAEGEEGSGPDAGP